MRRETQSFQSSSSNQGHVPVMLREVLEFVKEKNPSKILDCCFGGGGHTQAFLENTQADVIAVDRDPEAQARASAIGEIYGERFKFFSGNYSEIDQINEGDFDLIFYDLGISSFQIDEAERGFSFLRDAPLDMRMDNSRGQTAAEFLEKAPYDGLVRAIREYGEERNWKRIVKALENARGTGILSRTVSLARLIESVVPVVPGKGKRRIHPATQSFQGIRIAVNEELQHLKVSLQKAFDLLVVGGRLVVISFHSLEDRIVKRQFREWAGQPVDRFDSRNQQERSKVAEMVTRKPLRPREVEVSENPRCRSSILRVLDKVSSEGGAA